MPETAEIARAASLVLGAELLDAADLGGSTRSTVMRCRVDDPARTGHATVVVKQFHGDDDGGYVREAAGLRLLDRTPDLLAHDDERRLLVMTDLGDPPTLADLLLGADRARAWAGAASWARALGRLAASGSRPGAAARAALAGREWDLRGDVTVGATRLGELLDGAVDTAALVAEAVGLADRCAATGRLVLAPSDACPDNAVLREDGWWFLDLEGTAVQPVALVAAYAMMPFATCWCVFDPPPDLTGTLLTELTAGLVEQAPDLVPAQGWSQEVEAASATYVLALTGWLWESTLAGREHVGPPGRSPSYRQLVTGRWRWAATALREVAPRTAAACALAARRAWETWGSEVETTGYPAFADPAAGPAPLSV
ncbi:hypothetical protein ATJ88_1491 [Isoptericola jiangsuensis]|uniref:Phosphotransferase family enzyme n=1 Tax=Isoptericola jiangsuensis TaxID=548579 RepID=A0A2A9EXB8_9MICO|nr:hypothetical protein [Isoptericola jiangsuensis]PFG42819.1 hypothetical protein ATJ88_1491 [Isoptericola jiangsuensis]